MYLDIWCIIIQQDSAMSSKVVYQAVLDLVYAGKTVVVKSANTPESTLTEDHHKPAAQWSWKK